MADANTTRALAEAEGLTAALARDLERDPRTQEAGRVARIIQGLLARAAFASVPDAAEPHDSVFAHLSRESLEGFYMTALERITELEAAPDAARQAEALRHLGALRKVIQEHWPPSQAEQILAAAAASPPRRYPCGCKMDDPTCPRVAAAGDTPSADAARQAEALRAYAEIERKQAQERAGYSEFWRGRAGAFEDILATIDDEAVAAAGDTPEEKG